MKLIKKTFCVAGLGILLSGAQLPAAETSVKNVVNNAYAQIGSMDKYAFNALVVDNDMLDGAPVAYRQNVSVKIDRPGKLRADTNGDVKNRSTYVNNGSFTMIDHGFGYYTQLETPNTIDATLDFLFDKFGIRTPLSTLMYSDMSKRVKFKVNKYFGTRDVAGVECDYVAFKNMNKEIHIWITIGEEPLVKAFSIIEGESRINVTLSWDTNPKFSESDFVFSAPKDARMISVISAN